MKFKKEWSPSELDQIIKIFKSWAIRNLKVVYGAKGRTIEDTYGLPYTSSSSYAMVSNTNVQAQMYGVPGWNFEHLALTENGDVVAAFWDKEENEKLMCIGWLQEEVMNT